MYIFFFFSSSVSLSSIENYGWRVVSVNERGMVSVWCYSLFYCFHITACVQPAGKSGVDMNNDVNAKLSPSKMCGRLYTHFVSLVSTCAKRFFKKTISNGEPLSYYCAQRES